ncbi:MAG: TonB-dependent receptor plug domain-containing protein, partial [Sphingobium sp.]
MRHLYFTTAITASLICAAGAAQAQSTLPASADASEDGDSIIVTAAPQVRGNSVVGRDRLNEIASTQNVVDALKTVPGVSIRGTSATNSDPWSYGISIRGFDVNQRSSKIGQTIDGMPGHNASYYLGGTPAQKLLINENVASIQVNQGT